MNPVWLTAFLDFPAERFERGVAFWQAVTATTLSPSRGQTGEFATLVPGDGDAFLRVQRVGDGPARVHLDVHRAGQDFEIRRSPGGFVFCEVHKGESVRPKPVTWPGGHTSLVDQISLDIPAGRFDEECAFWAGQTGWELRDGSRPEFRVLVRPAGMPLRILLQRVDEPDGPVRAHLDLATTDRAAETGRHVALGATVVGHGPRWTVLRDPVGLPYCVTDRDPETGLLP
ncbi:VOC family protein [Pseudofrankia saprophytica]|uniref:VOC family protein n=1 Tax=Pseudofrankia saprophytica TaxID=298655 RepID=UPI000234B2AD|nr:VOC family protein [Pseudofrankia saprophytica]